MTLSGFTIDTIAARMSQLMETEHVEVEEKAIRYIARRQRTVLCVMR